MTEMAQPTAPATPEALVQALRLQGAHEIDPIRFHYIEVLAGRASAYQGSVRRVLDAKLFAAADALRSSCAQAHSATAPQEARTPRESLADLVRYLAAQTLDKPDSHTLAHATPRTELKSVHYFRNTWSKLSADQQVVQALERAPKNAGPINSHVVALRSLAMLRDLSPDYLNRFISYVDTLMCLSQIGSAPLPAGKSQRSPPKSPKK